MVLFTMLLLIVFMIFLIISVSAEDETEGPPGPPVADDPPAAGDSLGKQGWDYADPGEWVQGYEDWDALSDWLLGGKDEETEARRNELRNKFCEGIGALVLKDCAVAKMCESEVQDFEDMDGLVVGMTSSGDFISVMHAEGWRTPGMVFINETTGEVFTDAQRYLYKATWNVVMANVAGVMTKVTNPVNGYNVQFKENGVIKHRYFDDWYMLNATESHGFSEGTPFVSYSNKYYDELCLVLQTPIDVTLGPGLGSKSYSEVCNDIVEHTGTPTLLEQLGGGTPPPGVNPGFG